jgi:glutamine amidotransferase
LAKNITIIDYGVGNIASVANMLKKVGACVCISNSPEDILNADKVLLPGIGQFDHGMKKLHDLGLVDILNAFVLEQKKPLLGICLGAQILGIGSEEGSLPGLGWIDMECVRLPVLPPLRVPHMGWNVIKPQRCSRILSNVHQSSKFYFVHSYYMKCNNVTNSVAQTNHGFDFTSIVEKENIYGTQFHPEKSLKYGMSLMQSFVDFC